MYRKNYIRIERVKLESRTGRDKGSKIPTCTHIIHISGRAIGSLYA